MKVLFRFTMVVVYVSLCSFALRGGGSGSRRKKDLHFSKIKLKLQEIVQPTSTTRRPASPKIIAELTHKHKHQAPDHTCITKQPLQDFFDLRRSERKMLYCST